MRIPLAALGPVARRRRLGILLPVLAVAAVVAGVLVGRGGDTASRAAALAPPDTALWIRAAPEGQDRLWEIAQRFPSLRERLVDVRAWAGEEVALALPAGGGQPLLLVAVGDRAGAERFRASTPGSEFVGDFLVAGPASEVEAARERAGGGPSLADARVYRRAAESLDRAPVELYAPAEGLRRLLETAPALVRAAAAFADSPQFEGLAARITAEPDGVRIRARVLRAPGAPPAQEFAPALLGRAPATAAAFLDAPGADALLALLERAGQAEAVGAVRAALPGLAGIDLDRDVIGPLATEAALTVTSRGATPVITLVGRTNAPALTREALARLQQPLAEALGIEPPEFRPAGENAFTLPATPSLRPSYALDQDVLVVSTDESGLAQRTLARRGLAQELAVRAVADGVDGRIEALAFADLRQLLALGERTGLNLGPGFPATRDDLSQVRAASVVVRREESDSTAELFLEIP